ncbi:VCBS domain-containing protein [Aeromonas hydrophila]|uniref:VCBS domain-containing protein n=1 Tax=Aeromonas hydrophila TaxID=644 RepID=UPI003B75BB42
MDGTERTVTVTITGTNDKAIISGDAEGAVTEGNGNIVLVTAVPDGRGRGR